MQKDTRVFWVQYKEENDINARNELIINYIFLVKYLANRLSINLSSLVENAELISYGIEGLIDAIEKFDYQRNIKFETYAVNRIRGAMIDGIRRMDYIPVSLRQKSKELERIYVSLESKLGRTATDEEVIREMGITTKEYSKLINELAATTIVSLDDLVRSEEINNTKRIIDTIEDNKTPTAQETLALNEKKEMIALTISRLPEKEKLVVYMYYYEELTLKEIGLVMNLSESRISQLHTKAIIRLRGNIGFKNYILN